MLNAESRELFRRTLKPDRATWEPARGWAPAWGLFAYAYYRHTANGVLASMSKRAIREVLAEG